MIHLTQKAHSINIVRYFFESKFQSKEVRTMAIKKKIKAKVEQLRRGLTRGGKR